MKTSSVEGTETLLRKDQTMSFLAFLFQPNLILPDLYDWIILAGWAAVLLLFAVLAFFFLGFSRARHIWWQYFALLLIGGLGVWSIVVAYNTYQQWLHFNAQLPLHGHGINLAVSRLRIPYLAAIQTCQIYFTLTASILVLLLGVAGWQLLRAYIKKAAHTRLEANRHEHLWLNGLLLLIGICCLAVGVFLITKLDAPVYAPQDFQFEEPTMLELIGLFTVSLGGPLILLLLGITSMVRQSIVPR